MDTPTNTFIYVKYARAQSDSSNKLGWNMYIEKSVTEDITE